MCQPTSGQPMSPPDSLELELTGTLWSALLWSSALSLGSPLAWNSCCFPGGSVVKNPPANAGDSGSIPGSRRSPEEGNANPLHYSYWENSMDSEAWWATIHRVAKSQTRLSDWACVHVVESLPRNDRGDPWLRSPWIRSLLFYFWKWDSAWIKNSNLCFVAQWFSILAQILELYEELENTSCQMTCPQIIKLEYLRMVPGINIP